MQYVLEIIEGEAAGQRFLVREGLKIGRREGDLILNDRKVSSIHAEITRDSTGNFVLKDLGSSNGTYLAGKKVEKITLLPGVTFQIGKTLFTVVERDEDELEALGLEVRSWKETLRSLLMDVDGPSLSLKMDCRPFPQPIRLTFIEGPLTDSFITVGFGPRQFGFSHLDIDIKDPQFPSQAFELVPLDKTVQIKNFAPMSVLLNREHFNTETLKDGDTIQVERSILKINFL